MGLLLGDVEGSEAHGLPVGQMFFEGPRLSTVV